MANYILQYKGSGVPDLQAVKETLHVCGVSIIDGSLLPHAALLDVREEDVEKVRCKFEADWSLTPEKKYKVPDTKKRTE
ncbi:hypothetical protein [Chitinophaga sancti]|uniref:Uncharacterized protein n=1 Tax=Chitinophaga sancti TaxID=1004 RepID=A0A1K1M4N3_9BACT|nr:hypothetical protein [Chitinophaga sancti]WQD64633.1 hypothetical protein U0033_09525 [Chitinophaga sancti]WQG89744.1 hypothetical protein SR876_32950 [Chitinophaga sancti]SFW18092.1 hypothetical protein SAMN05661012_00444 [Chitinophaga sancti]